MRFDEEDVIDAEIVDIEERFESLLTEREIAAPNSRDLSQPYFLWTPIEDAGSASPIYPAGYHGVIGRTIPNQLLERGVITPCVTGRFAEPAFDENGQVFTEELAGANAEQLIRAEYKRGTIYLECLLDKGYTAKWVLQQKFHSAIFPTWPRLPELLMPSEEDGEAPSLYDYLIARRDLITKKKDAVINPKLTLLIIDEMVQAVKRADEWARQVLRESNTFIDLDSKDANWKPGYDNFDMLLFRRTGLTPRKEALDRLAKDRTVKVEIPEQKMDPALTAVLAQLAEGQKTLAEGQKALAQALNKK